MKGLLSRRKFLKAGVALAALPLGARFALAGQLGQNQELPEPGRNPNSERLYDCIIIGAGASGITAARELAASHSGENFRVLILEAAPRIGGRMHTLRDAAAEFGKPLELGAEYVHMEPGMAPIWNEIHRYGLKTQSIPKIMRGFLYDPIEFPKGPQAPLLGEFHWDLVGANSIFSEIDHYSGADISGSEFIRRNRYHGLKANSAEMVLSGHMPASLDDISILGFQADHITTQLQIWHENAVIGGYDSLLQGMLGEIGMEKLLLNHPVDKIVPSADGNYVSAYVPGVGWFSARSMLCSISIGALHARKIDFGNFWTEEKEASLRFIVPGHHSKFSIRFTDRFWPADMSMLNHIDAKTRRAAKTYFVPNYNLPDMPPVLTALIMGDDAKKIKNLSDADFLRLIAADLDDAFPGAAPTFNRIARRADGSFIAIRKQWMDDPFALGGNSFLRIDPTVGSVNVRNARLALASSENTKPLFWAGEATETVYQAGSVHGAHASGLRAAKEIRAFLGRKS